jgi:hypothetical protein
VAVRLHPALEDVHVTRDCVSIIIDQRRCIRIERLNICKRNACVDTSFAHVAPHEFEAAVA